MERMFAIRNKKSGRFLCAEAATYESGDYGYDETYNYSTYPCMKIKDTSYPWMMFVAMEEIVDDLIAKGEARSNSKYNLDQGWGSDKFELTDLEKVEITFPGAVIGDGDE